MWRTVVSIVVSALVGSVFGTLIYVCALSIVEAGKIPLSLDDLRTSVAVTFVASWFTVPGAILLAAVENILCERLPSECLLDGACLALGALAGAIMLGGLGLGTDGAAELAALGGLYGLITALVFVVAQRRLGARQQHV